MIPRTYVLAGGGTGGHLFPGLAVAAELRRAEPEARIIFLTTRRPLDREILGNTPYPQVEQVVRPLSLRPWHWPGFWWAWTRSVSAARRLLKETRPKAVLGLGGYAAGPGVVAAQRLGLRTAILNPDARPGRANRFLARLADLVIVQWEVSRRYFPEYVTCEVWGCPIREAFESEADPETARRHFGFEAQRPVLLVTGASQGARSVNRTIYKVWPEFARAHPEWQLLHLTGTAEESEARGRYGLGSSADAQTGPVRVLGFTHEMWRALSAADVVVSRAGASTLAELTALGKPSALLPYPYHRDRHQHANAQVLVEAGAAVLVEDTGDPERQAPALRAALERLADAGLRRTMSAAARRLGRPHAAHTVAAWLRG